MTVSVTAHFRIAWRAFKTHRRVFIVSMLVLFASWASLELCVGTLHRFGVTLNVLLHVAFLWLFSGLMVGVHGMALDAVDGRVPRLRCLTASLERGPAWLLAFCVYLLSVIGGLLLLVAPGVYVAARYALFGPVIATRPATGIEALRSAGALSHGRRWAMCRFVLAALALNVAGAVLLGLGLVISFPVSLLAASSLFCTLQHAPVASSAARTDGASEPIRPGCP